MLKGAEEAGEEKAAQFKQELFIHDRKLYYDMEEKDGADGEPDIQQITPMDEDEMQDALADMRRRGMID